MTTQLEKRDSTHIDESVLTQFRQAHFDALINEKEILIYYAMAAKCVFEVGERLLRRKANSSRGEFGRWLKHVWPDSEATARKWMHLALRMKRNAKLAAYLPEITQLKRTKIYELFELPEEELLEVCSGRNDEIMTLDDVSAMSTKALRDEVRVLRGKRKNKKPPTPSFASRLIIIKNNITNNLLQLRELTAEAGDEFQKGECNETWEYLVEFVGQR